MSRGECCPLCLTVVPGWAAACPKCRYHPDYYNRAQDDVAMIFRLGETARLRPQAAKMPMLSGANGTASAVALAANTSGWWSWLPPWLGGGRRPPRRAA